MTDLIFKIQIDRMRAFYGEKYFHPERVKMIAKAMKNLTDDQFQTVCSDILAYSNSAPTLKEFLKQAEHLLIDQKNAQRAENERLLSESPRCRSCEGDGYLSAIKIVGGRQYSYAFRCPDDNCLAAKLNVPSTYPKWTPENYSEFTKRSEMEEYK